jgi:Spy/CpxP family protein refolding chaperone
MMRGPASPAAMLLRQRERLALTPEQVTRLETLAAAQQKALAPVSPAQQLRLRADLLDATSGTGNPQAARAVLDKMSAQRNERIVAGLRARQEAQAVLTDAQRTQVESLRTAMRQRVGRARAGRLGDARGNARFRAGRGPDRADVARGRRGNAPDDARPSRPRRPDAP